jgi:hypothetical protein
MGDVKQEWAHLMEEMRAHSVPTVARLRPGTARSEILRLVETLGLILPDGLICLYEQCDGVSMDAPWNECTFYYYFRLLPIIEAKEEYERLRPYQDYDIGAGWWPLMRGTRDYFFVETAPTASVGSDMEKGDWWKHGAVLGYDVDMPVTARYQSVAAMLQTFAACWAEGAFVWDVTDVIVADADRERSIIARFNPKGGRWNSVVS